MKVITEFEDIIKQLNTYMLVNVVSLLIIAQRMHRNKLIRLTDRYANPKILRDLRDGNDSLTKTEAEQLFFKVKNRVEKIFNRYYERLTAKVYDAVFELIGEDTLKDYYLR